MKFKILTISTISLFSVGCSLISSDIPACDSDETREIIKEITASYPGTVMFKDAKCIGFTGDTPTILADSKELCELEKELSRKRIESLKDDGRAHDAWFKGTSQEGAFDKSIQYEVSFMNSIVFADDLKTNFESFLVKEETKSEDGNSKTCKLRYRLETISVKGDLKANRTDNLTLTLYKKNSNGDREYTYRLE